MAEHYVPSAGAEFAAGVADAAPSLRPLLDGHLTDNAELLPHVLFGFVTEAAHRLARRSDREAVEELGRLLGYLESGLASRDPYITELIRDSFIENVQPRADYPELRSQIMLRPLLREAYVEIVDSGRA
jgi:hypothetical protein